MWDVAIPYCPSSHGDKTALIYNVYHVCPACKEKWLRAMAQKIDTKHEAEGIIKKINPLRQLLRRLLLWKEH